MPSHDILASILAHAPDFLAHITPDGKFLFLNRFIPGLSAADLKNRTIYDFTDANYHEPMKATIAQVVLTGAQHSYETVGPGPNARPAYYFTRVAPVLEDGVVSTLVLIATDVTRLKEAEAARTESEAALQLVLSATGMGTWWWQPATNEGWQDSVTAEILGLDPGTVSMEQFVGRIHPEDRERTVAALAATRDRAQSHQIEYRVVRPDGSLRWVSASGRYAGNGPRFVGGLIDVTARKKLEAQFAQAQKLESVGRLAGGIAHDFNNMLTAILSYTEFAAAALPQGSPVMDDLLEIKKAADRSVALTTQLLAFARQQVIEPKVIDLNRVVLEVDKLLRRVLGEDIEIVTALRAKSHVRIDPNQFEQVLMNLATNARDAMPKGGQLTIETTDVDLGADYVEAHPNVKPGPYVVLAMSDSGTGIAAHHLAQIFEPFFTTKAPGQGTGLGLAMVYGVVAQNHGHITVYSEAGRGTTFKIHLPVVGTKVDERPASSQTLGPGGNETILLAEDEPMVRAIAVKTLVRAGYRVLEACNGIEALEIARGHVGTIHLLLTDVIMPQLGGELLARQLTADRKDIGVLFVSGYTDNSVVHHGILDEGVDFLQKPFTPSTLLERVRQALERRPR